MQIAASKQPHETKIKNFFKRNLNTHEQRKLLILDISQTPFEAFLIEINDETLNTIPPKIIKTHASMAQTLNEFFLECSHKYPIDDECIILALPREYHSLKLSFPFKEPERIEKLLPQELEELCPFDPSEFVAGFAVTSNGSELSSAVHVSLVAKETIKEILESAKSHGFDPISILPPSLGARTTPLEQGHEALIFNAGSISGVTVLKDGVTLFDSICKKEELKKTFTQMCCLFEIMRVSILGMPLSEVEYIKEIPHEGIISIFPPRMYLAINAGLQCLSSIHSKTQQINFRKEEFRVSYDLKDFFNGLIKLKKQIFSSIFILLVSAVSIVSIYQFLLSQEEKLLRSAVGHVLPEVLNSSESPLILLKNKTQSLEQQLKDLGSPFSLSPIEALEIISKDLPVATEIEVKNITIKGKLISLQGMSSGYAPVERLKRDIEKKKRIYCSEVKTQLKGSSGITRGGQNKNEFSLEVTLCE